MYADDDYGSRQAQEQTADFAQGPSEIVDYGFSWAGRLDGDTIASNLFELPDGLTNVAASFTTTDAVIFVSGAVEGSRYRIKNTVTTAAGRTWSKTIWIVGKAV
jgi:hypothetical protein